jgi:ATP-dependent RNA helicase DHX37/DHR1
MGRKMAAFPLLPRFSKILLSGHAHGCLPYTIALVAALSVPDIFLPEDQFFSSSSPPSVEAAGTTTAVSGGGGGDMAAHASETDTHEARCKAYKHAHHRLSQLGGDSDALKLLAAVLGDAAAHDSRVFCAEFCLRHKAVREAQLLRQQLAQLLRADPVYASMLPPSSSSSSSSSSLSPLPAPSKKQVKYLKLIVASGFVDQVAIRADLAPVPPEQHRKPKSAAAVPYLPLMCDEVGRGGDDGDDDDDARAVYIHPASVLAHRCTAQSVPPYIVYASMQRSANKSAKVRLHPLTPVSALQLAALTRGTPLQSVGKPLKEVTVDGADGLRRVCWIIPTLRSSAGTQGWPLPARKIVQRRVNGVWIEEGE